MSNLESRHNKVEGWPVAQAGAIAGVSRQTAHKLLVRFREEGLAGLSESDNAT